MEPRKAKRVRIYLDEDDRRRGRPLHRAVFELLHAERALGATVFRGAAGFGAGGRLHTGLLVDVIAHLPIVVEWIDTPEQVERLLPQIHRLVDRGLVTVEDTEIVLFTHGAAHGETSRRWTWTRRSPGSSRP